jgi:LPXTG-site transpeptidase (sortase) family protein
MRHVLKVKTVRKTGLLPVLSLLGSLGLISMAAHAEMNQVAGERDSIRAGDRVGRIAVPRIALDLPLLEMGYVEDRETLDRGPSHISGSVHPGGTGNCVIAGHRSTFNSPFRNLGQLAVKDEIFVEALSGKIFHYQIDRIFTVTPQQVEVMAPTPNATITLITCHPIHSKKERLIVQGHLVAGSDKALGASSHSIVKGFSWQGHVSASE